MLLSEFVILVYFCWEYVSSFSKIYCIYRYQGLKASFRFFFRRKDSVLCVFFLLLEFNNSLVAPVKEDPMWAPFTALSYKELELLISVPEVGLPISLRLADSIKH